MIEKLKNIIICLLTFCLVAVIALNVFYKAPKKPTPQVTQIASREWYDNIGFTDKSFSFQLVRKLGLTIAGGADIGECFTVAQKIKDGDVASWHEQWFASAERLYNLSQTWEKQGHAISAGGALMRATNYYLASNFYLVSPSERQKRLKIWQKSRESFLRAKSVLLRDDLFTR